MTTRRRFIEGAVASGILAVAVPRAATALVHGTAGAATLGLERVVYDERFAAAQAFAQEARRRSVATSAINGSVHDLWYDDLYHRWRDAKRPIAGMTDHRALLLLEMMAADAGMRVVHRVHHYQAGGAHAPAIFGPTAQRAGLAARLSAAATGWPVAAAGIVTGWPAAPTPVSSSRSDISGARGQAVDSSTLVSWLIR
jgi:hypothetical protein